MCHAAILGGTALVMAGCGRNAELVYNYALNDEESYIRSPFRTAEIAGQIDRFYRGVQPGPIGVTTFVDLNDLYKTSAFGRIYSEQLMGELAVRGYDVVELRQADALQILGKDGGEFALSRDTTELRRSRDLGAIVVGTYMASPSRVYVNARLINPANSAVLSAGGVEIDRTREVAKLLQIGGMPGSLERIPVKHLSYGSVPLMQAGFGQRVDPLEAGYAPRAVPPPAPQVPAAARVIPPVGEPQN
jgi:TolB-like protein